MECNRTTDELYSDQDSITEWLAELDNTILVLRDGTENDKTEISLNALAIYCESVFRLNRGLGMVIPLGQVPETPQISIIIDQTVGHIIEASKRVDTLRSLISGKWIETDSVVSYATKHARSWNGIAVKVFQVLIHLRAIEPFRRILEVVHAMGYESEFLAIQLELEVERIAAKVSRILPETNILAFVNLKPHESENVALAGISSASKTKVEGTTEGTKTATAGDNADISEKKSGRVFCDKCRRLKENWFNRIRIGGDIPLQTFLKEFFANPRKENIWNPIRNGEKKPVTWEAMEKKFRANEVDWKPEYTALLSELRGTNGGH